MKGKFYNNSLVTCNNKFNYSINELSINNDSSTPELCRLSEKFFSNSNTESNENNYETAKSYLTNFKIDNNKIIDKNDNLDSFQAKYYENLFKKTNKVYESQEKKIVKNSDPIQNIPDFFSKEILRNSKTLCINNQNGKYNVNKVKNDETIATDYLSCFRCHNLSVEFYCNQCANYLCTPCKINLHMKRENQNHSITSLSNSNTLTNKTIIKTNDNYEKDKELYQINCHYNIHKNVLINDNIEELKEKLTKIKNNMTETLNSVQDDLNKVHQTGISDIKLFEDKLEKKIQSSDNQINLIISKFKFEIEDVLKQKDKLENEKLELKEKLAEGAQQIKYLENQLEKEKYNRKGEISRLERVWESKFIEAEEDNYKKINELKERFVKEDYFKEGENEMLKLKIEELNNEILSLRNINNSYYDSSETMKLRDNFTKLCDDYSTLNNTMTLYKKENEKLFNKCQELIGENVILKQKVYFLIRFKILKLKQIVIKKK